MCSCMRSGANRFFNEIDFSINIGVKYACKKADFNWPVSHTVTVGTKSAKI